MTIFEIPAVPLLGVRPRPAVLRELARSFPQVERITTYNAADNAPMVAVNRALGFELAGQLSSWGYRRPAG